jgi:lipid-binding SYLF domain-containing protein
MKYLLTPGLALLAFVLLAGCATPKGATKQEQRNHVLTMKDETLTELYAEKPETKDMVRKAAGYGVFSSIGTHIFLLATGNGYGVVVDNATGKKTYMKMNTVGVGLGAGLKDFRAVFIFKNKEVLTEFIEEGWEFGAAGDVAAKSGEKGGAMSGEKYVEGDIVIYQLTEAGIALQATVGGTKYRKYDELN